MANSVYLLSLAVSFAFLIYAALSVESRRPSAAEKR
jgi:hypothetical protein